MIRLLIIMLMLPIVACSQNDLGFWEGTPEKLDGCKQWRVQSRSTDPVLPISMGITDCYGNEKTITIGQADGSVYFVCSMDAPVANVPILVQSITESGLCGDPFGFSFQFYLLALRADVSPFPDLFSEVRIYSWNGGSSPMSLIYQTTSPQNIEGPGNAVTINDSYPTDRYYSIEITARRDPSKSWLAASVSPGQGLRASFTSTSFTTHTLTFAKREFYLTITQPD